jgi:hypothetical protein
MMFGKSDYHFFTRNVGERAEGCLTRRAADLVVGRAKMEESKRTLFPVSTLGPPPKPLTRAVGLHCGSEHFWYGAKQC